MSLLLSDSLSVFPGSRSRQCQCWGAGGWGRSSSSLCSWTRHTGRVRAAGRALTSWSMSLRGGPRSFSRISTLTGSKSLRWMCDEVHTSQIAKLPKKMNSLIPETSPCPVTLSFYKADDLKNFLGWSGKKHLLT